MSIKYLKVKIKSLAVEGTIIRKEEHKAKKQYRYLKLIAGKEKEYQEALGTFWGLRHHRTADVRNEARAAQWAYGYLRGKRYRQVESKSNIGKRYSIKENHYFYIHGDIHAYIIPRVVKLVNKYGHTKVEASHIEEWLTFEEK
jgi:hypothetical protein